jgi:sulfite reductase (NADPH) flavoprotein alpha-component
MKLKFISVPEGQELFQRMAENETVNFADVLREFPTARPTIEQLMELIPEIKPRHYSIASSQEAVGDKVELLIVTVDWKDSKGRTRYGQCTRYLNKLQPPVIMAGLGTGMAPFRAFAQHRAWQRTQGIDVGPLILYFGSRYRAQEYLYGEEMEAYLQAGILTHAGLAFSRDGPNKVYIQHKMKEDKEMLAKILLAPGQSSFYLCGPTWPVPDIYEALTTSFAEEAGWPIEKAQEYIDELKEQERYVLEVY